LLLPKNSEGTSFQLTSPLCATLVLGVTFHSVEQCGKCGPRTVSGPGGYLYLHVILVLNMAALYSTRSWCVCYVMVFRTVYSVQCAVCSLLGRSRFLFFSFSFLNHSIITITVRKIVVLVKHLDIDLSLCGQSIVCVCYHSTLNGTEMSFTFGVR